jgi:ketosteroid isomerase-like protein
MKAIRRFPILAPALAALLTACQSAPPPPAGLSDADRVAIQEVADQAVAIMNSPTPDLDAYVRVYYAQDAVVLPPNGPVVSGEGAISSFLKSFPPITKFEFTLVHVEGTADMAWVQGSYNMTMTPEGSSPINDTGKYIEIWKKQATGDWKVVRDIFNSDLPPAPATEMPNG